jgi:anaerobic selenocysteine-containing dehydrogenase
MNRADIADLRLESGDKVILSTVSDDGVERSLGGLQVVPYDIPQHCVAGYYPECNVLIPLSHYADGSKVPASKSVPVRIRRA